MCEKPLNNKKNNMNIMFHVLYYHIDNITHGGNYETKGTRTFQTNISLF